MTSLGGPMNVIPAASHRAAKSADSETKPQPTALMMTSDRMSCHRTIGAIASPSCPRWQRCARWPHGRPVQSADASGRLTDDD